MKIINRIIRYAIFVLIISAVSAYASQLTFTLNPDDSITVSGTGGASLKRSTVTLYAQNKDSGVVQVMSGSVKADGSFEFVWTPKSSGEHLVEVRAGKAFMSDTYWYASVKEYNEIMDTMASGDKDAVKNVIADSDKLNKIGLSYDDIRDFPQDELACAICVLRDYINEPEKVLDIIPDAGTLSMFFLNKDAQSLNNAVEMLEGYGITFTNYKFFTTETDEEFKEEIQSEFADKLSEGLTGADAVFTDCIILTAVRDCGTWSMLDKYLALLEYDAYNGTEYCDYVAKTVAGESYSDRDSLIEDIDRAIEAVEDDKKASGGGSSSGSSGGSSGGYRPVTVPTPVKKEEPAEENTQKVVFSDVTDAHWAFEAINYLRWEGIVTGSDFNSFYPDNTVTRAEMTAMLTRAYGISGGESSFTDVNPGAWYYAPISAAYVKELVSGDGETFRPDDYVTRQDMAVLIYRFARYAGKQFGAGELEFKDSDVIADYAREAVAALCDAGIINGIDNESFAPIANATRAQAAQMIYRSIRK